MSMRFQTAFQRVLLLHPFFSTILYNQNIVKLEGGTLPGGKPCPYMAVGNRHLYYNAAGIEKLTDDEIVGVLCHEACHVAFLHDITAADLMRVDGAFAPEIFNIAADFVINAHLAADGVRLPTAGCHQKQWDEIKAQYGIVEPRTLVQMDTVDVYDHLMKAATGSSAASMGKQLQELGSQAGGNDLVPFEGEDLEVARSDAVTVTIQAAAMAKQAGKMPGFAEQLIGKLTTPKANWRAELWQFMTSCRVAGYTFTRPNRRFLNTAFVMPSFGAKGLPALNAVFDSSGSVPLEAYRQFLSELNGAVEAMGIKDVVSVVCDSQVQAVHHHTVHDGEIRFSAKGRGGTDMNPAFDVLKEMRPAPTIVFSDMEFYCAVQKIDMPVLWCRVGTHTFPAWGRHIDVT